MPIYSRHNRIVTTQPRSMLYRNMTRRNICQECTYIRVPNTKGDIQQRSGKFKMHVMCAPGCKCRSCATAHCDTWICL